MNLGYVIIYVKDVAAARDFYARAFGLEKGFIDESETFGEMKTGQTALAFAQEELLTKGVGLTPPKEPNRRIEIALTTPDVPAAFSRALDAGAGSLVEPEEKPWGQVVAYVEDPFGTLVEICTPMG
ncbi:VOC family protein [Spirochaeta lutea]|uniref:Glyoxalase n=1 Tax=Spirochaeta lutea TaxID=1480694 RepID=A0A098R0W1_9SPIO|nr:VOC family protein [Spirochaeta lutea]KGE73391.1 glyoxalase [Spirochaeta lutea]